MYLVGSLVPFGLTGCKTSDPPPPTDLRPPHEPTASELPRSEPSPIVDVCRVDWGLSQVCVLHEDGGVSCADPAATEFEAPIPLFQNIVELECGYHWTCGLDERGTVRCLGRRGAVGVVEGMGPARSLAKDCAIGQDNQLYCWGESLVAEPTPLPKTRQLEHPGRLTDLVRAWFYTWPPAKAGCALQTDGRLWCWMNGDIPMPVDLGEPASINDHTEERRYEPYPVAAIEDAEALTELEMFEHSLCWRGSQGWSCIDEDGEVDLTDVCDVHPCTCHFPCTRSDDNPNECVRIQGVSCESAANDAPPANEWVVTDVVRHDAWCVLTMDGEVWCQGASRSQPPHRIHQRAVRER